MNTLSVKSRLPTLFVSHDAPTLAIEDSPAHRFLTNYGRSLGKPEAILMLSAHFDSPSVTVTAGNTPGTIHDFGGFPKALYDIRYPAPGNPVLANRVTELLQAGGVRAHADPARRTSKTHSRERNPRRADNGCLLVRFAYSNLLGMICEVLNDRNGSTAAKAR